LELINIQVTNKNTLTKNNTSVFVLTRDNKIYTSEGINYIRESLKEEFDVTNDLSIFTGIGINMPTVLAKLIKTSNTSYVVLSHKDGIGFFPATANDVICETLLEGHNTNPDMTSWQIIMKASKLTLS